MTCKITIYLNFQNVLDEVHHKILIREIINHTMKSFQGLEMG